MNNDRRIDQRVTQLCGWYGDGGDRLCPSAAQWQRILAHPGKRPITLINFFKFRQTATYAANHPLSHETISGQDAFDRYASVSVPTMERVGGKFLLVGPFAGMFIGDDEDWDVIAVGSYPDAETFMNLYSDPGYRTAFQHRTAACLMQKVIACDG